MIMMDDKNPWKIVLISIDKVLNDNRIILNPLILGIVSFEEDHMDHLIME